jgi:hypothetical protein
MGPHFRDIAAESKLSHVQPFPPATASSTAAMFESSSDNVLWSTAFWLAKAMKKLDWSRRHDVWQRVVNNKPKRFQNMVAAHFSPDELLKGSATGLAPLDIIVLPGKRKLQTNLESYFAKRPARQP